MQTLVFPESVPLFAVWRENSRNEAEACLPELESGKLQIIAGLLGDTRFANLQLPENYGKKAVGC